MAASAALNARVDRWIDRRHRPTTGPATLGRRQIYILPTAAGWSFILSLLVMLLWAINYSNSLAFALTFLLGAVMLTTMWRTRNVLLDLRILPLPAQDAFAGDAVDFCYRLDHPDRLSRHGIGLQWPSLPAVYADVAPHGSDVTVPLAAPRRGRLRPPRLRVVSRFPLGLFQAWSYLHFDQQALVYPQPRGRLPLPAAASPRRGDAAAAAAAGHDDFAGLRSYVPGDSPRRVAWRASARGEQLLVKQFSGDAGAERWFDWRGVDGDDETRLSQLCRWVLQAERERAHYGLRLPGSKIAADAGPEQRRRCLHALALYGGGGDNNDDNNNNDDGARRAGGG